MALLGSGAQVTVIRGNSSKFPKRKSFAYKSIKGVKTHSDVTIGTIHLKQLATSGGAPLVLSFPIAGMDPLTQHHAPWTKPKLLAFLVGLTNWTPVTISPGQDGKHSPILI